MSAVLYRPDIQGLRAVAVLAVMLFHGNPAWLPGGFVGVDVFLIISGYLIVSILLRRREQPGYRLAETLRYFYGSRFKRIAPAYFAMLAVVSLLAAVLLLPQDLAVYERGLNQAALFNSNSYFAGFGDYFAPASHEQPLLHTWSLAVEIQFYLLIPLLVLLAPPRALKWVLGALIVGLTAVAEFRLSVLGIQQATYYSLYARLPEFFAGSLVALHAYGKAEVRGSAWCGYLGLTLVLVAAAVQPRLGHFPGLPALLPVAGATLVLLRPAQGIVRRLLENRPMVWVGELSYSLYLWHWPVLALMRYYTGTQVLDTVHNLWFVGLTLLMATLSYYGVETPLRARRASTRQALAYGVLAVTTWGTSQGMVALNQALSPPPLPTKYRRYADPVTICHGQIVGDCLKGDLGSDKEVLVLGDSHAAMLNLFFDQLGKELGFRARIITASSCVTIPGFDYQRIDEWAHEACLAQIKQAKLHVKQANAIFLGGMWSWQLQSDRFKKVLAEFLHNGAPKAQKYLISQVPLLNKNPMRSRRFDALGLGSVASRNESYLAANDAVKKIAETGGAKVIYLSLDDLAIFERAPLFQGSLIYYDESHMNEVGVLDYAGQAKQIFRSIVKNGVPSREIE